MASPSLLQACARWDLHSAKDIQKVVKSTVVKIIEHRPEHQERVMAEEWIAGLEAEGVNVSLLSNPCVLEPVPMSKNKQAFNTPEHRHALSDDMWQRVIKEPAAGAIAISQVRAVHEGLRQYPDAEIIIVMEADVTPGRIATSCSPT